MSTDGESFSGLLLRLRGRIALTQRELATRVGVNVSSIQGWEAGANYPSVANLKALIGAAFLAGGFGDGHAADEAAALWAAAVRDAPRFRTPFDRAWFDQTFGSPNATAAADTGPGRRESWAEASDVAEFIGRASERALLRRWVLEEHVRVIALFGIGGIGKSLLATRVARDLVPSFENVVWRSLRDAQTPAEWLAEVVGFLVPDYGPFPQAESTLARHLLEILAEKRCLLVLDNLETVLEARGRVGTYVPGYERYGVLLRQLAETPHQSCVIVTSRE
jgi:transcriptional regulator with XRE-family HTH domain